MSQAVVDVLEPVQIDEQHGHLQAGTVRVAEGVFEP